MPRQARVHTSTNVYHAILRGVNKQQIFEDDDDYLRFLDILRTQTVPEVNPTTGEAKPHCRLYAYCLMGNHVHLLMQEVSETVGETMKRIASSYVYHYNHRYGRIGHLFQERFKSQPVNDWEYFVTLLRYIHQNPTKGHIVEDVEDYPWSSWLEYINTAEVRFCSTGIVLKRMPITDLLQLVYLPLSVDQEKDFIDIDVHHGHPTYTDKEVWQLLETLSGTTNATQFQALPRPEQKHILYAAHEAGVGPRTLSRLTGVPYSIVQRATSGKKGQTSVRHRRFTDDIRANVSKKIQDEINVTFQCCRYSEDTQLETLYFLITLRSMRRKYHLSAASIENYMGVKTHEDGTKELPEMNAISISLFLYNFADKAEFDELRTLIVAKACDRISHVPKELRNKNSETVILLLDLMACPYLTAKSKTQVGEASGLTKKEIKNLLRYFKNGRYMFTNWKKLNVTKELNAKISQEVYT